MQVACSCVPQDMTTLQYTLLQLFCIHGFRRLPFVVVAVVVVATLASATNSTVILSVVQVLDFHSVGSGMPTVYDGPFPHYICPNLVIFPSISVAFTLSVVVQSTKPQ